MSAVVLRCPHCGTTQARAGECAACHDADVRPYCPNHEPGRWLDGPTCAACGAGIGRPPAVPPARPSPPPAPQRPSPPRPPRPAPARAPTPAEVPGRDDDEEVRGPFEMPWGGGHDPRGLGRDGPPPGWPVEAPPIRITAVPLLGCVRRLFTLALFALVLLTAGTCWFLGGGILIGQSASPMPVGGHDAPAARPIPLATP